MIKSMTAYAGSEKTTPTLNLNIEIRTYNSRYLDMMLRLPHGFMPLEDRIKKKIGARLERGRVEMKLAVREEVAAGEAFEVDEAKARAYQAALKKLQILLGGEGPLPLEMVAGQNGIITPADVVPDWEAYWRVVAEALDQALDDLDAMRAKEGAAIERDFKERIDMLEAGLERIAAVSDDLVGIYRQRLTERVAALVDDIVTIDPGRIAQEAVLLADRSDISEEIVRIRSHLVQFKDIMAAPEPAGRKLNFLLQELNREFNTIGSKTDKADVAHTVVDLKTELEKIREQVQNIE